MIFLNKGNISIGIEKLNDLTKSQFYRATNHRARAMIMILQRDFRLERYEMIGKFHYSNKYLQDNTVVKFYLCCVAV
jgi:hypothetical protein